MSHQPSVIRPEPIPKAYTPITFATIGLTPMMFKLWLASAVKNQWLKRISLE